MSAPVKLEELKIVLGQSGKGLQVVCSCGCVNWNHVEMPEAIWSCRNCRRVFTNNFPELVRQYLAQNKQETPAPAGAASS